MEHFELILIYAIYLIGIPITYAIMEGPEDNYPFNGTLMTATLWPVLIIYIVLMLFMYPFYWITKKIKNKL